jgi:hypothetical protein
VLEGVANADLLAVFLQQLVGGRHPFVVGDAEHALGGVVVRLQLGLPLCEPVPLAVGKERRASAIERVCIAQAAAADAVSGDDEDVLEQRHPEDPSQPQPRHPEVAPHVPGRLGEVLVGKATTALQHPDAIALLGQPQGGDAAPEPRPDHEPVVVPTGHRGQLRTCAEPHGHC